MFLVILGLVAVFYFGVAILVARLCSINSRWERLAEKIPAPQVTSATARMKSALVPGDDEFLEERGEAAPPAS